MKKFLVKTLVFLIPVVLIHVFTFICYKTDRGDLIDVGYVLDFFPNYRDIFKEAYKQPIRFTNINTNQDRNNFNIFTIGDSFSEEDNFGYKNYLAAYPGIRLLHYYDRYHNGVTPFQALNNLLNGGFFDNKKDIKFVILESVERNVVALTQLVDVNQKISEDELSQKIEEGKKFKIPEEHFSFPSDRILKFPVYNVLYLFNDSAIVSPVCKTKLTRDLFSAGHKDLLFLKDDIYLARLNNNKQSVDSMNVLIDKLSGKLAEKGIKLIYLICPDKLDLYYNYIVKKEDYPKPLLLDYMDTMKKDYLYVPSKKILSAAMKNEKDIYFYGDTHWSPWAAKLIAADLNRIITGASH